jgi:hypothetical protein
MEEIKLSIEDWEEAKKSASEAIKQALRVREFNEALIELANKRIERIKEEQEDKEDKEEQEE